MLLLQGLPAHYDQHLFRDNYKKFKSKFSHTFLTCTVHQMKTYGTLPGVTLIQSKSMTAVYVTVNLYITVTEPPPKFCPILSVDWYIAVTCM